MQTEDILNEREKTHGDFEIRAEFMFELATFIAGFFNERDIVLHKKLSAVQYMAMNQILGKISRIYCGDPNHPDHWDDIAGYAMLGRGIKFVEDPCTKNVWWFKDGTIKPTEAFPKCKKCYQYGAQKVPYNDCIKKYVEG